MLEDDLLAKLKNRGYNPETCHSDEMGTSLLFPNAEEGRLFAGSLLTWGIPRIYLNNLVNAKIIFNTEYLHRILEIL